MDVFDEVFESLTPAEREAERRAAAHLANPLPTVRWPDGVPRGAAVLHELNATLRAERAPSRRDLDELELALALIDWRRLCDARYRLGALRGYAQTQRHLDVLDESALRRAS